MVDYRRSSRLSDLLGYRDRRKLLLRVLTLGVVVIAGVRLGMKMLEAPSSQPESDAVLQAEARRDAGDRIGAGERIDTRLRDRTIDAPGAVPVDVLPDMEEREDLFPGVDLKLLAVVEDGTLPTRSVESKAYYHLMGLLVDHDAADFDDFLKEQRREEPVGFAQLFQQSSHYRGQVVRVKGTARAAFKMPFGKKNPLGLEHYYHLYLETPDKYILTVHVLEPPESLKLSEVAEKGDGRRDYSQILADVEVVGFYYKRMAYQARDDMSSAPLILAKTLTVRPPPTAAPEPEPFDARQIAVVVGGALVFGLGLFWLVMRQNAQSFQRAPTRIREPSPEELTALAKIVSADERSAEGRESAGQAVQPKLESTEKPTTAEGATGK